MNFQQLRIIRETVKRNYNLTEVANALYTSQSGVSKHIRDLEDELGVELFIRKGKRFLGLTDPGKSLVSLVERILLDAKNIKQLAEQFSQTDQGQLVIATTHTQARYALPQVIEQFKKAFPKVHLILHQASPDEIVQMLLQGQADIGIATESLTTEEQLVSFPYYQWKHAVIVPKNHPLTKVKSLTLEAIAQYPLITYHQGFTGRQKIDELFLKQGLTPDIILSALDADVIKTYVELNMGVGIIASIAYQKTRDTALSILNADHLFPDNTTSIAIRKGHYLRGFVYPFLTLCSAALSEKVVKTALLSNDLHDLD